MSTAHRNVKDADFMTEKFIRRERFFVRLGMVLAALILLCLFGVAKADDATVEWTAPTTYTDDTPITKPIVYNLYNDAGKLQVNLVATKFFIGGYAPGFNCWTVTAIVDGVESDKSARACKIATVPGPVILKPKTPTKFIVR